MLRTRSPPPREPKTSAVSISKISAHPQRPELPKPLNRKDHKELKVISGLTPKLSHSHGRRAELGKLISKFHGRVKTEGAVAVGCSAFVRPKNRYNSKIIRQKSLPPNPTLPHLPAADHPARARRHSKMSANPVIQNTNHQKSLAFQINPNKIRKLPWPNVPAQPPRIKGCPSTNPALDKTEGANRGWLQPVC